MSFLRRVAGRSLRDRGEKLSHSGGARSRAAAPSPSIEESAEVAWASISDAPWTPPLGRCSRRVPPGEGPCGRPRTRWRDYVSRLAWERRLGIPRKSWRKCLGTFIGTNFCPILLKPQLYFVFGPKSANANMEVGPTLGTLQMIKSITNLGGSASNLNMNLYATKKTAAEGMLDIALFLANITHMKTVIEQGAGYRHEERKRQRGYYIAVLTLISFSLALQIVAGVLIIIIARRDLNVVSNQKRLDYLNNLTTGVIFVTT
ncbi:hypothetical protein L3Q82_009428, partial [Scortum barcoo]